MRSPFVVVAPPILQIPPGLVKVLPPVRVQALIAKPPIERLDEGVLDRAPGPDEVEPDAAGEYSLRQVPCPATPRRRPRPRPQERVRASLGTGSSLHQGPEVHAPRASGEPLPGWPAGPEDLARRQQAAQHGVPAQRIVRAALEL